MNTNGAFGAVSFRYMILDQYKNLALDEKELATLLMIDHLLEQGNTLINADALSLKMSMSSSEIDSILAVLLKRELISYEIKDGRFVTTLDPICEKLGKALVKKMNYESEKAKSEERDQRVALLNDFFEDRWSRTLTPLEKEKLYDWVEAGYKDLEIQNALRDGLREGKVNVRYIDRRLRAMRAAGDIEEEGYTATSETWSRGIGDSLKLAKEKWEDEE